MIITGKLQEQKITHHLKNMKYYTISLIKEILNPLLNMQFLSYYGHNVRTNTSLVKFAKK